MYIILVDNRWIHPSVIENDGISTSAQVLSKIQVRAFSSTIRPDPSANVLHLRTGSGAGA